MRKDLFLTSDFREHGSIKAGKVWFLRDFFHNDKSLWCGLLCFGGLGSRGIRAKPGSGGPAFSDPLLLGRPHVSKVSQPPETVLPAGDQRFKQTNLWRAFYIQPILLSPVHLYSGLSWANWVFSSEHIVPCLIYSMSLANWGNKMIRGYWRIKRNQRVF